MSQQLAFPFLQQGDEFDALAHMLTAKVVNIVQAMASPEFRWTPGADTEIARVRVVIAEDLRTRLKQAAPSIESSETVGKLPKICEDCGIALADPPSRMCPACQAYAEHQA